MTLRAAVIAGVLLAGFPSQVLAEDPPASALRESAAEAAGTPEDVPSTGLEDGFVSLDVGVMSCGVRASGVLECWGYDSVWGLPAGEDFTMVSVGDHHACGLRGAGEIECWGAGWEPPPQGLFKSVSVGSWYTCGLRLRGEIECWGTFSDYEPSPLRGVSDISALSTIEPPGGEFSDVQVSKFYACGLRPSGEVECWGARWGPSDILHWGEIGDSPEENMAILATLDEAEVRELEKRPAGPGGAYVEIAVGDEHACGLLESGEVECWHACGHFVHASDFVHAWVACSPDSTRERSWAIDVDRLPDGEFVSISAGGNETCGVRPGGGVECWHTCSFLGLKVFVSEEHDWIVGDCEFDFEHYSSLSPAGEFVSVAASHFHGCGILVEGGIACWEFPPDIKCETQHRYWWGAECAPGAPVKVHAASAPAGEFVRVESGGRFFCGMRSGGEVECWGFACESVEAEWWGCQGAPAVDGRLRSLAVGPGHVCGLRPDKWDNVVCWGDNGHGESSPPWKEFTRLAAGTRHTCGLRPGREVECWGRDEFGESTPPEGEFTDLALGDGFSCGLLSALSRTADGSNLVCWGRSELGESSPPEGRYTQLTAGYRHACALLETREETGGGVVCWGDNYWGQSVAPSGVFTSLTAGADHTCGLRPTGESECWGGRDTNDPRKAYFKPLRGNDENRRELRYIAPYRGSSLFDSRSAPPAGGFTQLTAGTYNTCGLRPAGGVECWTNQRTHPLPELAKILAVEPVPNFKAHRDDPDDGIKITWEPVNGKANYELRLNGGEPVRVNGRFFNEYTFERLELDRAYSIELRSVNNAGASEWSQPRLVILASTGNWVITPERPPKAEVLPPAATAHGMTLTWKPVDTAETYEVHITQQFFTGTNQEERHWKHTQVFTGITNTTLNINTLQPATTYRIDIWTRNAGGTTSTSLNTTTPPQPPQTDHDTETGQTGPTGTDDP